MKIKRNTRWYQSTLSRLQRQLKDAHRYGGYSPAVRNARINKAEERLVLFKLRFADLSSNAG